MLSRLLWMALPSLTLASGSRFFCWMALGIWARMDLWRSMVAFTSPNSFSSSTHLASSRDNSGSTLREEFFKRSIDYDSSLASCLFEFPLANRVSWSNRFLWAYFTFRTWYSKMKKGDKTLERARDGLPLMAKKALCIGSVSWTKSAIFFSNIGRTSLSWFLVSYGKVFLEEVADELISPSPRYSLRLKE